MIDSAEYGPYRDLLYQCKFRTLLEKTGDSESPCSAARLIFQAAAFFELHRILDANRAIFALETCFAEGAWVKQEHLYLIGRISFFHDDFKKAEEAFLSLRGSVDSPYLRGKALLGLGNVYCWTKREKSLFEVLEELDGLNLAPFPDLFLSREILHGNVILAQAQDIGTETLVRAQEAFKKALRGAALQSWLYFMQRSLHGLARVAKASSRNDELRVILETLRLMVDESQSIYMSYIINRDFQEENISVTLPMELDDLALRVRIRDKWVTFHDRPLLYQFLRLISRHNTFVQKDKIVANLWPEERYNPAIHDSRVYDVARRVRSVIEAFDEQPVILLSGRSGYKMAYKGICHVTTDQGGRI